MLILWLFVLHQRNYICTKYTLHINLQCILCITCMQLCMQLVMVLILLQMFFSVTCAFSSNPPSLLPPGFITQVFLIHIILLLLIDIDILLRMNWASHIFISATIKHQMIKSILSDSQGCYKNLRPI